MEALKERLQRQADVASRAELALTQLAVSSQATQAGLAAQLEEARAQAAAALAGRRELEAEYERLREERAGLRAELAAAQVRCCAYSMGGTGGAGAGRCTPGGRRPCLSGARGAWRKVQAASGGRSWARIPTTPATPTPTPTPTSFLSDPQDELRVTREELARDRATLAGAVRSAAAKEEDLEGAGARLRAENDALAAQVAALQRRLEEEQEVVEAAKSQLLDYKNIVIMVCGAAGFSYPFRLAG